MTAKVIIEFSDRFLKAAVFDAKGAVNTEKIRGQASTLESSGMGT